jgi:hypothetical protein
MSERELVTTQLRIPWDVWRWLGETSAANVRSRNGELVWHLRQRMAQEREQDQQREAAG